MSPRSLPQVPQIPDAVHHLTPTPFLPLRVLTEPKSETSSVCLLFLQWLFAASIMLGAELVVPGDTGVNRERNSKLIRDEGVKWKSPGNYYLPLTHLLLWPNSGSSSGRGKGGVQKRLSTLGKNKTKPWSCTIEMLLFGSVYLALNELRRVAV